MPAMQLTQLRLGIFCAVIGQLYLVCGQCPERLFHKALDLIDTEGSDGSEVSAGSFRDCAVR